MPIKRLSERTINQIAAGEVVERPISVIKELIENSLDAGAQNIKIELERGGRNLIRVIDDGGGIHANEIELALERHATSKLDEQDISDIRHFGFRGEALPAIASVSKMRITSKHPDTTEAITLEVIGGAKKEVMPAQRENGTTIEVRDLFCFTPNRLKFLKSEANETAAALDIIKKFALVNPTVNFTLSVNNKILLHTKSHDPLTRMRTLLGEDFSANIKQIHAQHEKLTLTGYIGLPTFNLPTAAGLYFYVNNRIVKDKLLSMSLRLSYQDVIPKGRHPAAIVFLTLDPSEIDVNVHPTKAEVRFKDENLVRSFIIKTIRNSLQTGEITIASTVATSAVSAAIKKNTFASTQHKIFSPHNIQMLPKRADFSTYPAKAPRNNLNLHEQGIASQEQSTMQSAAVGKLGYAKFQVDNTYIVAEAEEGLIVIDQHAAHERLVLEKMKEQMQQSVIHSQNLLIPYVFQLSENHATLLAENKHKFAELGLLFEKQGMQQIIVRAVPLIFGGIDVEQLCAELASNIESGGDASWLNKTKNEIYANIACHASIRAGRKLSIAEMNAILRQMEASPMAAQCNHGRPTTVIFKAHDLAKIFERI